jgi:hypothetical protein
LPASNYSTFSAATLTTICGRWEAFYGRQAAYCAALADPSEKALEKALARNIFGLAAADGRAVALARYARAAANRLSAQAGDTLVAGVSAADKSVFPSPEAFADA